MKKKYSLYVLYFVVLTLFFTHTKKHLSSYPNIDNPIKWDVFGYYLYLPATFIYKDIGIQNKDWLDHIYKKYEPSDTPYQIHEGVGSKNVIVYQPGYSIVYAPGFFIAHLLSKTLGFKADGFSVPYQWSLYVTSFFVIIIGLIFFRKILLTFFNEKISALVLFSIVFGSNYFFSAYYDPVMVHTYLFTINSMILWSSLQWIMSNKSKHFFLLCLSITLATLCRPTEIIWILVPLLGKSLKWVELKERMMFLLQKKVLIIKGIVLFIVFFSIYLLYLYYVNKNLFQINFHTERLALEDPYLLSFLFSYKKGWLIYTPLMIFVFLGLYKWWKMKHAYFLSIILFLILNIYLLSSWECWWYGASFGQRSIVESYVLLALPIGYFFKELKNKYRRIIVFSLLCFFILLNLFQTWQYRNGLIHIDRMTKKAYWKVFASTTLPVDYDKLLSVDFSQTEMKEFAYYQKNYIKIIDQNIEFGKTKSPFIVDTPEAKNKKSILSNKDNPFTSEFSCSMKNISTTYFWTHIKANVYILDSLNLPEFTIVCHMESKNRVYKYATMDLKKFKLKNNEWNEVYFEYLSPYIRHKKDRLKIYVWNLNGNPLYINEFNVKMFIPKHENK